MVRIKSLFKINTMAKKTLKTLKKLKKKVTQFRPRIKSRHPSHRPLRNLLSLLNFKSVVRLGSTTRMVDDATFGGNRIECNPVQAIKNSADKLLMKRCFQTGQVKTASWVEGGHPITALEFPLIAKHRRSSRGEGIYLLKTIQEYNNWCQGKTPENYIIEKYHDFSREYRLHVTADGCFYACRKMLREGTPENQRWYRNDSNCVWVIETNPLFNRPANWNAIVAECVKSLNAVGLDIGACDVRVQSATKQNGNARQNVDFFVVEINSAPSFGEMTLQHYTTQIPRILKKKFINQ